MTQNLKPKTRKPKPEPEIIELKYWDDLVEVLSQGAKLEIQEIMFKEGVPCMLLYDRKSKKFYMFWNYDHYEALYGTW